MKLFQLIVGTIFEIAICVPKIFGMNFVIAITMPIYFEIISCLMKLFHLKRNYFMFNEIISVDSWHDF